VHSTVEQGVNLVKSSPIRRPVPLAVILFVGSAAIGLAQKVDTVRVIGCLKHEGAEWLVKEATDPVVQVPPARGAAPAPAPAETAAPPPAVGRNQYKLIGVTEFNLPSRENQRVAVTGLFIKATPTSRINITTVVPIAPSCGAPKH
jgi:hypothetical protein